MEKLNLGNKYFVHELTGMGSFEECYHILDKSKNCIASAEEDASFGAKIAKMFFDKALVPATINVLNGSGDLVLKVKQMFAFPQTNFTVSNPDDSCVCILMQKLSLVGSCFAIYDPNMSEIASITGGFRNKRYLIKRKDGSLLASIDHKNSGFFRDFMTTADDYEVNLSDCNYNESLISLAAALCVDFAFHES